ncbi:MAG: hypothetical protein SFW66_00600 [Gammaproteobacteria bacterium]|nr:hypothetical protein [Gammaproteobacteria bacterium]
MQKDKLIYDNMPINQMGIVGDTCVELKQLQMSETIKKLSEREHYFRLDPRILHGQQGSFSLRLMSKRVSSWVDRPSNTAKNNEFEVILDAQVIPAGKLLANRTYLVSNGKIDYYKTLKYWSMVSQLNQFNLRAKDYLLEKHQTYWKEGRTSFTNAVMFLIENADLDDNQKILLTVKAMNLDNMKIDYDRLAQFKNNFHLSSAQLDEEKESEDARRYQDEDILEKSFKKIVMEVCTGLQKYVDKKAFGQVMSFFKHSAVRAEKQNKCAAFIQQMHCPRHSVTREEFIFASKELLKDLVRIAKNHDISTNGEAYDYAYVAYTNALGQTGSRLVQDYMPDPDSVSYEEIKKEMPRLGRIKS